MSITAPRLLDIVVGGQREDERHLLELSTEEPGVPIEPLLVSHPLLYEPPNFVLQEVVSAFIFLLPPIYLDLVPHEFVAQLLESRDAVGLDWHQPSIGTVAWRGWGAASHLFL